MLLPPLLLYIVINCFLFKLRSSFIFFIYRAKTNRLIHKVKKRTRT